MARKPEDILDELLVLNIQAGNQKAMTTLVKRYHTMLISYAYTRLNDPEAAKDVVQDTWKVVFSKITSLKDPASFRSWIYRILNNKAVDSIRTQIKSREAREELSHSGVEPADTSQQIDQMKLALSKLDPGQRTLIELYYRNDMSVSDISEILKIPSGTVKSRLFKARKSLKELINLMNK